MIEKDFVKYIQCDCGCCAVGFEGFEIEYTHADVEYPYAEVWVSLWSRGYGDGRDSFWKRLKNAWYYLRGRRVYADHITLQKEGVAQLHNITTEIMEKWPSDEKLKELQEERWRQIREIKNEFRKLDES